MSENILPGAALRPGGVSLRALPAGGLWLLLGRAGAPAPDLPGADLRPAGPGQWFLLAEELPAGLDGFAVSEQGHGRLRIALEGPDAAALLAKGTALDLDALGLGASAQTLIGPIGAHVTRLGPERFELMVLRSYAESLWHDLAGMAAEYGGIVGTA
jgi:sarcosine oxidase subunit gamma